MYVIYREKHSGKTEELIKLCSKDRYSLIVAPDCVMCAAIFQKSKELKIRIPYPITFGEFVNRRYQGKHVENFYIDNLDVCLQRLTEVAIKAVVLEKNIQEEFNNALSEAFEEEFINPRKGKKPLGMQIESTED